MPGTIGKILMDLPKGYDCISHVLLIAKNGTCSFNRMY